MAGQRSYQTVNLFFAGAIMLLFAYSLAYPPSGGHPVPSFYTLLSGQPSPTAGLSRSFSAILRGDLPLARTLSPYGIPLFLFLLVQLIMRITAFVLLRRDALPLRRILTADVILSVLLFLVCYDSLLKLLMLTPPT